MTPNNNLSVLPWYDSIDRQNHRRDYAFGNVFPLITPDRKLLPFQIIRPTRTNAISQVILRNIAGKQIANIITQMKETGLTVKRFASDGYDVIIYPGILPMAIMTPEGQYYAELYDGVQRWYSEVFTIKRTIDNSYLTIEWWDDEPLYFSGGHIEYSGGFRNKVYLCTQVGKPEYNFEEEGEKRDGYFYPEKQVSEKVYKFTFIAPEYLCDVMRIIRMSDHVQITSRGETYNADSFLMTPKWQEQGDIAAVEVEFETDTVVKKIGRGLILKDTGDFSNDFNYDFKVGELPPRNVNITVYGNNISDSSSAIHFQLSSYAGSTLTLQVTYTTEAESEQKTITATIEKNATSHKVDLNERISTKVTAVLQSKGEDANTNYKIN